MARNDLRSTFTRETPQALADTTNRARLLDLLCAEQGEAPTMADLRQRGVQMPGQALYELELDGYPVERVRHRARTRGCGSVGYRLSDPSPHTTTDRFDPGRVR
jgi:hypothetical protein